MKVVDESGSRITIKRAASRYAALFFLHSLSFGISTLISLGAIAMTQKEKGIHDFIARTEVVRVTTL
jgi:uncharacterized RDD family membrane protein YckC